MDKQKAADLLDNLIGFVGDSQGNDYDTALKMGIKALQGDPDTGDMISRQAAIDALNQKKIYRPLDSDRYVISDCINAIVNLPSAHPDLSEYSDKLWKSAYERGKAEAQRMTGIVYIKDVINRIAEQYSEHGECVPEWLCVGDIPRAIQPQRMRGRWVEVTDGIYIWKVCDQCGEKPLWNEWRTDRYESNYCPNCGADMRGGEQDDR